MDDEINIGFEFEFIIDLESAEIMEEFTNRFGVKIRKQFFKNQASGKHWVLTEDTSCTAPGYVQGWELISPVMPLDAAAIILGEMFDFFEYLGVITNKTTGLHINIDIGRKSTKKIDLVELVMLIDDKRIIDKYDRAYNSFCTPFSARIERKLKSYTKQYTVKEIKSRILDTVLERGKWSSINFMNLEKRGYIEFRMIGGLDYHKRLNLIFSDMIMFVNAMVAARYNTKTKTVIKKINSMLNLEMKK